MLNSVKYTNTELGLQTEHYQHFKVQQNGIPTLIYRAIYKIFDVLKILQTTLFRSPPTNNVDLSMI